MHLIVAAIVTLAVAWPPWPAHAQTIVYMDWGKLKWTAPPVCGDPGVDPANCGGAVDGYAVKCGPASGVYSWPSTQVSTTTVNVNTITTQPGTYYCVVTAKNPYGESGPSHEVSFEIPLEDCLPYDPFSLRIVDEGAQGWLLTDRRSRMLILDNEGAPARRWLWRNVIRTNASLVGTIKDRTARTTSLNTGNKLPTADTTGERNSQKRVRLQSHGAARQDRA